MKAADTKGRKPRSVTPAPRTVDEAARCATQSQAAEKFTCACDPALVKHFGAHSALEHVEATFEEALDAEATRRYPPSKNDHTYSGTRHGERAIFRNGAYWGAKLATQQAAGALDAKDARIAELEARNAELEAADQEYNDAVSLQCAEQQREIKRLTAIEKRADECIAEVAFGDAFSGSEASLRTARYIVNGD